MKKILCLFFFLIFLGVSPGVKAQTATVPAGSGTNADPYRVATLDNLYWISKNSSSWASVFVQTADIDASSTTSWNSGAGFCPIGMSSPYFTGTYDGCGYAISGLTIKRSTESSVGFFGTIATSAIVSRVKLSSVTITGGDWVGSIVGYSKGVVSSCSASGSITGKSYVGGVVGGAEGTIMDCGANCSVTGTSNYLGGLVGRSTSNVCNCYAAGNVTSSGGGYVGGLIGGNYGNCSYSFSVGAVSGKSAVGGFIGDNGSTSSIKNDFWDTESSGKTSAYGSNSTGVTTGITGKTSVIMKTQAIYTDAGWDFTSFWSIDGATNSGYPFLLNKVSMVVTKNVANITNTGALVNISIASIGASNPTSYGVCWNTSGNPTISDSKTNLGESLGSASAIGASAAPVDGLIANTTYYVRAYAVNEFGTSYGEPIQFTAVEATQPLGSGTSADPYRVETLENLYWISKNSSSWASVFVQTANIDASVSVSWDAGLGFPPIGPSYPYFTGTYDGRNYEISNLIINIPN